MHVFNLKPTLALLLAMTTANVVTANMHRRSHIHRRADVQKRAGGAYNETEAMASRSVELGHQASLSSVAAASSSSVAAAAAVTTSQAAVVTTSAVDVEEPVSSTAVAVTSSAIETDDVVTSTATAAATTPLAVESSLSSSSIPSTSSLIPTTSSTVEQVLQTTSTSTSTVIPTTSIIRSTVTPTQEAFSSAASLVRTTARTASASASVSAAASTGEEGSKGGLSKTALIAIIVVASVIIGALAIWTIIRKWKLGPSKKFDERMQPLDFSPNAGMPDPFLEKTRNRFSNSSVSSADRQRRQFVSELDAAEQEKYAYETQPNYLHGVPSHDFTAPPTGGVASSHYAQGGAADYDPYGYPPHGGVGAPQHDYSAHADETVGGNGYADLRRGPSTVGTNFAGMGAGPGGLAAASNTPPVPPMPQGYDHANDYGHEETLYSDNPGSLGRPTQGEGPYAASRAHRY